MFGMHFYGFAIIKVVWNDKNRGYNLQMSYKTKLLKHEQPEQ